MIQANGRMKTDLMFAALIVVVALSLALYGAMDGALTRMLGQRGFQRGHCAGRKQSVAINRHL